MPRMYSSSVRRQIVARLRSGEPVAAVAVDTGICQATLFRWKRQALIDAGVIEGTPSVEADELAAAHKRIAALESELALTRDACELFDEQAVVPPKRRRAIAEGLIARGHSARSACRITGLARSLLQSHRRRPVPDREVRRLIVADTITEIHQRSRGTYGRRRVRAALLADYEMNVNLKLVNSIMSEHGLYGLPRPGRRKPNLIGVDTPADLVNRRFTATGPNELWCTDITEHPARDGKVYCCAILDCFSRMIVAAPSPRPLTPHWLITRSTWPWRAEREVAQRFCTLTTGLSSRLGASGRTCGDGVCSARLAPSATASITPPWSHSGRGCRSSCSTPADGPPLSSWPPPWPITSTTSITPNAVTATSVTSAPQSLKRSGRPPIRSLNSRNHGSKRRGQINPVLESCGPMRGRKGR
jgi:transposase-like protein